MKWIPREDGVFGLRPWEYSTSHGDAFYLGYPPLFYYTKHPHNCKISNLLLTIPKHWQSLMQRKRPSAVLGEVKVTDDCRRMCTAEVSHLLREHNCMEW